jgi:hypothetical protein
MLLFALLLLSEVAFTRLHQVLLIVPVIGK